MPDYFDALTLLREAAAEMGWSGQEQITQLCEFINSHDLGETFNEWLVCCREEAPGEEQSEG